MLKCVCNRCGREIVDKSYNEIVIRLYSSPSFDTDPIWIMGDDDNKHFCDDCISEILDFIHTSPRHELKEPEPELESSELQTRMSEWIDKLAGALIEVSERRQKAEKMAAENFEGVMEESTENFRETTEELYKTEDASQPEPDRSAHEKEPEFAGPAAEKPLNESGGAEPEEKKVKKPARKRMDKGKILALKAAGWSVQKIADEMGTSENTIYSVIHRQKKMEENGGQ